MSKEPLNAALNYAVNTIADRVFPFGYNVRPNAPNTYDECCEEFRTTGQISIWDGDYTNTGFGDTETWRNFRAWHDFVHVRHQFPFDMPGEYAAATFQSFQIYKILGRDDIAIDAVAQLWAELIGPLEARLHNHTIPCARQFVREQKPIWRPLAERLAATTCHTSSDALREAAKMAAQRRAWGTGEDRP